MELTMEQQLFVIFLGLFMALIGMAVGLVLGYFIGRNEERKRGKTWDFDKLKRSDHFHYPRRGMPKDGK